MFCIIRDLLKGLMGKKKKKTSEEKFNVEFSASRI